MATYRIIFLILIANLTSFSSVYSQKKFDLFLNVDYTTFHDELSGMHDTSRFLIRLKKPDFGGRINYKNWGFEIFANKQFLSYNSNIDTNRILMEDTIMNATTSGLGFMFHYSIIKREYLLVSLAAGVQRVRYRNKYISHLYRHNNGWLEGRYNYSNETILGPTVAFTAYVPFYKRLYLNTNIRYSNFPTATFYKNSVQFTVGIGYNFSYELGKTSYRNLINQILLKE